MENTYDGSKAVIDHSFIINTFTITFRTNGTSKCLVSYRIVLHCVCSIWYRAWYL